MNKVKFDKSRFDESHVFYHSIYLGDFKDKYFVFVAEKLCLNVRKAPVKYRIIQFRSD